MSEPLPPKPVAPPRKGSGRISLTLFLLFAGFELFKFVRFHAPKHIDVNQLHLVDLQGQPIPASAFANKAVLLNYWAPWCGPCKLELPWLAELQRQHPNDLLILGIVDDPQDYADAITTMRAKNANYPLAQLSRSMQDVVGPMHTVPTTFYLSRSGNVLHAINGAVPQPVLKHWVNDAIAAK